MRVAVFGGSFHPPHVGHALVAAWALWTGEVDEVWLVPVFHHAFAKGRRLAPFKARVSWCEQLGHDVHPRIRVSTIESRLPTPSYTLHTLEALALAHPEHQFQLLIGSDVLDETSEWHRWDRIEAEFSPIVVGRSGYRPIAGRPVFPEVSSTDVRALLAAGDSVAGLLTAGVAAALGEWTG